MADADIALNTVKELLNTFFPNGQINRSIVNSMSNINLEKLIKSIKKLLFKLERIHTRSVD